jgi:hypothetical protein
MMLIPLTAGCRFIAASSNGQSPNAIQVILHPNLR